MWHLVLLILGGLALRALYVFIWPDKPCECGGRCGRCKGTGRRFRRGARLVRAGALLLLPGRRPWRW